MWNLVAIDIPDLYISYTFAQTGKLLSVFQLYVSNFCGKGFFPF